MVGLGVNVAVAVSALVGIWVFSCAICRVGQRVRVEANGSDVGSVSIFAVLVSVSVLVCMKNGAKAGGIVEHAPSNKAGMIQSER